MSSKATGTGKGIRFIPVPVEMAAEISKRTRNRDYLLAAKGVEDFASLVFAVPQKHEEKLRDEIKKVTGKRPGKKMFAGGYFISLAQDLKAPFIERCGAFVSDIEQNHKKNTFDQDLALFEPVQDHMRPEQKQEFILPFQGKIVFVIQNGGNRKLVYNNTVAELKEVTGETVLIKAKKEEETDSIQRKYVEPKVVARGSFGLNEEDMGKLKKLLIEA